MWKFAGLRSQYQNVKLNFNFDFDTYPQTSVFFMVRILVSIKPWILFNQAIDNEVGRY